MSVFDLMVDGFPHGLPAGFEQGCRGARECSNFGTDLPLCRDAAIRYRSDYGYKKLVDAGLSPEDILGADRVAAELLRPKVVAARQASRDKAERAEAVLREKARVKADRETARLQAREQARAAKVPPASVPVDPAEVEAVRVRLQAARIELRRAVKGVSKAHSAVWAAERVLEERRAGLVGAVRRRTAAEKAVEVSLAARGELRAGRRTVAPVVVPVPSEERKPRVKSGPKPRVVQPCGTNASYARGCRCAECREANRLYMADYRAKRLEEGTREESHGTAWGYQQGCRRRSECPGGADGVKCPDASLAAERDRRRAAGVSAAPEMTGSAVAAAHVRILLDAGMTHMAIAERAGVSKSVVKALLYGRRDRPVDVVAVVSAERLLALVPGSPEEMREQ